MANILVIEDEEHNRFLLCRILEAAGHTVLEAGDGNEALSLLKTSFDPVSLIILDVRLPRMDGFEFLAHLREEEKARLPVLVLTAHRNLCARAEEFGARACLIKPFKRKMLLSTVDQLTAGV